MKTLIVLAVFFVVVVSGCTGSQPDTSPTPAASPSPSEAPQRLCAQVITPAQNLLTMECRDFSTPCDVPEGWTLGCAEQSKEKNVTVKVLVGESKNVTLNGVDHTIKFLGAESPIEAAMQVDRFGNVFLKGRLLNVTGTQGKVGVYVDDVTVKPAITKQTSVTVTLVDLNETFGAATSTN